MMLGMKSPPGTQSEEARAIRRRYDPDSAPSEPQLK